MGIFDNVGSKGASSGGLNLFGNSPLGRIGNTLVNQGLKVAASKISSDKLPLLNAATQLVNGRFNPENVASAVGSVINSGVLNRFAPGMRSSYTKNHWLATSPLTAKLSQEEVRRLIMLSYAIEHARKNLWILNIAPYSGSSFNSLSRMISNAISSTLSSSVDGVWGRAAGSIASTAINHAINATPIVNALGEQGGGIMSNFNMLATEVNYSPFSIEAEQYNVGAAIVDGVKSSQQAEISITTMDDEQGTIKRFFKQQASAMIHKDGTVGILLDGLVQIRVLHAFVSDNTNNGGFEETIIARPVSIEYDFNRREDAMQEFTMRFIQTDTFIQ
ncbi:hypothetical protein [Rodentibacter pneumotropicus]|uniref:Uncharacterized protein n=1 Tax=Rodentibacter pneumotropicus TaxID=758 RepID=A0A4S2QHX8_9PAST|nr:hypothetical protein [Rodentibacter pneumotropicus]THA06726.1 hypothetical protein D3M77_07470 [Rodentibacter pneumotropicus]THA16811.1 hypothetical protein D3M76_02725 [Rodentibacter pneumotropicus]